MKKFGFIICPENISQLKKIWPAIRFAPNFIVSALIKNKTAFIGNRIKGVSSIKGEVIEGFWIVCPLLSDDSISGLTEQSVLERVIDASRLAKGLDVDILGSCGCTSLMTDREHSISKKINIPTTTGGTLATWTIIEAVHRIARIKNLDLRKSHLVIIGAATPEGSLCAKKLAEFSANITIVDQNQNILKELKETIINVNPININIEQDLQEGIQDADIIINADYSTQRLLLAKKLKSDAIICEPFDFKNLNNKIRSKSDITIIKTGLIKLPLTANLGINIGLPKDVVFAALAETMLLTFENKFINYSWGKNINPDKLDEIADIAVKHGFEVWVPEAPIL